MADPISAAAAAVANWVATTVFASAGAASITTAATLLSLTLVGAPGARQNLMEFAANDYLVYNQAVDTLGMVIGGAFSWVSGADFFNVASATGEVRINGTKVIGPRQAAIQNATSGTEIATINAILTRLRAHGLIAT